MNSIFSIYKAVNVTNGKTYIGFDSSWPRRQKRHKYLAESIRDASHFHRAIRKYGWNAFEWSVVYQSHDGEHTKNVMEPYFIEQYRSFGKTGYNMTKGGDGVLGYEHTQEHRLYLSTKYKGRKLSEAQKKNLSAVKTGKKLTKEHRDKVIRNLVRFSPRPEILQKRAQACSKRYVCISPNGEVHYVRNLTNFSKQHELDPPNMFSLANGRGKTHRGWKCFKDNTNRDNKTNKEHVR